MTTTQSNNWKWNFAAGFVPLTAGFILLITSKIAMFNEILNWPVGLARLDFNFQSIAAVSSNSGAFVEFLSDLASVNIVNGALSVVVVSYFGLRQKQKWAWWYLLVALIWLGGNDAYAATEFFIATRIPLFAMPYTFCLLTAVGLIKTRKEIFEASNVAASN